MFAASATAVALRPQPAPIQQSGYDLEALVPQSFGDWTEEQQNRTLVIDPNQQQTLDTIYSQTLSRTYINGRGDRVMLSIAYGGIQNRTLQVHRPETCYLAQGFQIGPLHKGSISLRSSDIPVMRLMTHIGDRYEPVTYWVRMGKRIVLGNFMQSLARVTYGLSGSIPDGLLFRVSSLSREENSSYELQGEFVAQLLQVLTADQREFLIGG